MAFLVFTTFTAYALRAVAVNEDLFTKAYIYHILLLSKLSYCIKLLDCLTGHFQADPEILAWIARTLIALLNLFRRPFEHFPPFEVKIY